jgi:hypothetical protein
MLAEISSCSDRSGHELAVRPGYVAGRRHPDKEGQMGQKQLFAASVAALILACVAGWAVVSDSQPSVAAPAAVHIDPLTMMTGAKQLPTEHFADYSFVFN